MDSTWDENRTTITKKITTDSKLSFIDTDGNSVGTIDKPATVVEVIVEEELPIIEKILNPVDENIDKTAVTEMTIDTKYFMQTDIIDRKNTATIFNFDYLSYLFFQVNINENIPSFYNAVDSIIEDAEFDNRPEDSAEVAPENEIDNETTALIFNQI